MLLELLTTVYLFIKMLNVFDKKKIIIFNMGNKIIEFAFARFSI